LIGLMSRQGSYAARYRLTAISSIGTLGLATTCLYVTGVSGLDRNALGVELHAPIWKRYMQYKNRLFSFLTLNLNKFKKYIRNKSAPQGVLISAKKDFSLEVPFQYVGPKRCSSALRIAAVVHIFYTELCDELWLALKNIDAPCDLYITTNTADKANILKRYFSKWPNGIVNITVFNNRGRDIWPKLSIAQKIRDKYDLFLFLHSKKSPQADSLGMEWKEHLINSLIGSPEIFHSILDAFETFPNLGLIFPQHPKWLRKWMKWSKMYKRASEFANRIDITLTKRSLLDFPAGSMYWARSRALDSLLKLDISEYDFEEEKGQFNDTFAHVIERMICYIAEANGYFWMKTVADGPVRRASRGVEISTPNDLKSFRHNHVISLTK